MADVRMAELPEQILTEVVLGQREYGNGDLRITRIWRMTKEPTRIHYVISDETSKTTRRLYEDKGSALYSMLQTAMENG